MHFPWLLLNPCQVDKRWPDGKACRVCWVKWSRVGLQHVKDCACRKRRCTTAIMSKFHAIHDDHDGCGLYTVCSFYSVLTWLCLTLSFPLKKQHLDYLDFNFLLEHSIIKWCMSHNLNNKYCNCQQLLFCFLSPGLDKREDTTDYHSLGTVLTLKTSWLAKHHDLTGLQLGRPVTWRKGSLVKHQHNCQVATT